MGRLSEMRVVGTNHCTTRWWRILSTLNETSCYGYRNVPGTSLPQMKRDGYLIAMHKIIPKEGNLVRVEVSKRLTQEDYDDLIPRDQRCSGFTLKRAHMQNLSIQFL